jgi:transcription initiation factor TFIIIB Brf1 subunit/transcription initiation factor TFIIB
MTGTKDPITIIINRKRIVKRIERFHEKVEEFQIQSEYEPPKCISDKILLYIRYALSQIDRLLDIEMKSRKNDTTEKFKTRYLENYGTTINKEMEKESMRLYLLIRGESSYTTGFNPRGVAAAIIYIATMFTGLPFSQAVVGRCLATTSSSIRHVYVKMKTDFNL